MLITVSVMLASIMQSLDNTIANGPNFTRPEAPSAARYTSDTQRSADAAASDSAQHIALGQRLKAKYRLVAQVATF